MEFKHCSACGQPFQLRPQVPNQSYCSEPECQRERRRRWQRDKLQTDPDYRDNQSKAQRAWMDRNADYWRKYREANPEYVERNRNRQRIRDAYALNPVIAKMDVSVQPLTVPSGVYRLRPVTIPGLAKMDALTVEITLLSVTCPCADRSCKEMT